MTTNDEALSQAAGIPLFHESLLICDHCGQSSPNRYLHDLNHHIAPDGECTSARLQRMHAHHERTNHA